MAQDYPLARQGSACMRSRESFATSRGSDCCHSNDKNGGAFTNLIDGAEASGRERRMSFRRIFTDWDFRTGKEFDKTFQAKGMTALYSIPGSPIAGLLVATTHATGSQKHEGAYALFTNNW